MSHGKTALMLSVTLYVELHAPLPAVLAEGILGYTWGGVGRRVVDAALAAQRSYSGFLHIDSAKELFVLYQFIICTLSHRHFMVGFTPNICCYQSIVLGSSKISRTNRSFSTRPDQQCVIV